MVQLSRFIKLIKPYMGYFCLNLFFNILFVIFSFFSLALIAPFLALIFGLVDKVTVLPAFAWNTDTLIKIAYYYVGQIQNHYGAMEALLFVAGLFVASAFFSNLFRFLGIYFLSPIRAGVIQDLRNELYAHILALPMAYFSEQRKGDLIARTTSDMNEVEWAVAQSIQSLIKDPVNVLIFLIALIAISPALVLFVLLVLPITAFIVVRIGKKLKRDADKTQSRMGGLLSTIEESISGLRIIKSFNLIDLTYARFRKSNQSYTAVLNKTQQRKDLADPLTEFLSIGALILVIWFGGNLVLGGSLRADVLILFVIVFARLISPAKATANAYYNVQKGRAALQRIYEVIDEPQRIVEKKNALRKYGFSNTIVYKNVCFTYTDTHEDVLKEVNLEIRMGETLAIVGHSGSGKTTLVDLLPRFYDCTQGGICMDGIDLRDLNLSDLRNLIGVVTQNPFLWNDTIANNIRFGRTDMSMEQVMEAAKKAFAHDFIMEMPDAYETVVGDLGTKLSGGQRQRIVIARVVLKNAPILILDEATSALDTESEQHVQMALTELMKGRTSIVIAHRLSTVQHADRILVLDKGQIMEEGTHKNLLEKGEMYAKLIEMQL